MTLRARGAVVGAVVVLIVATVLLLRAGSGPNVSQVLGFLLAVAGLVATLWGLRRPTAGERFEEDLATKIDAERTRALRW